LPFMAQQQPICPRCAKRLPASARFCRRCGMTQKPARPANSFGTPDPSRAKASAAASAFSADTFRARYPSAPPPFPPQAPDRPKRPPTRGPVRTNRSWSSAPGCWFFIILGIFVVRACSTATHSWNHQPPPQHRRWTPTPELDDTRKRLREHPNAFDRNYFPDDTSTPAPPAPEQPARPNGSGSTDGRDSW
jgi:hypothetical protein